MEESVEGANGSAMVMSFSPARHPKRAASLLAKAYSPAKLRTLLTLSASAMFDPEFLPAAS